MNVSMNTFSMSQMGMQSGRPSGPPPPPPPEEGSGAPQSVEDILSSLDADESGGLSATEVADSPLSNFISEDNWSEVDTDGDGSLSASELEAHRETVGPPPGGGMGRPSEADAMSVIESLLSDITESSDATTDTAQYADDLYSAMQNLLSSVAA